MEVLVSITSLFDVRKIITANEPRPLNGPTSVLKGPSRRRNHGNQPSATQFAHHRIHSDQRFADVQTLKDSGRGKAPS